MLGRWPSEPSINFSFQFAKIVLVVLKHFSFFRKPILTKRMCSNSKMQPSSTLECNALSPWPCMSPFLPGLTGLLFPSLQNTQRISSSQSTQPLATPVVSVTTPSLPPQGLVYSAMPTAYNTGKPCWQSGAQEIHFSVAPDFVFFFCSNEGSYSSKVSL